MVDKVDVIKVVYKELDVGALSFDPTTGQSAFIYMPEFVSAGIERGGSGNLNNTYK